MHVLHLSHLWKKIFFKKATAGSGPGPGPGIFTVYGYIYVYPFFFEVVVVKALFRLQSLPILPLKSFKGCF